MNKLKLENQKRMSKKKSRNKSNFAVIAIILAVIALGILVSKKPSTTGFAVLTEEKTYEDNVGLALNESGNYTWDVRNPGDIQSIKACGIISKNGSAKVYIEKGNERTLLFDSTKKLFDVNIQVLPEYKKISQGDELLIQIVLFNLKGFGKADVNVKYSIKDKNGNSVAAEQETITVETQAKFVRKLLIPQDLATGTYTAFVEVKTPDGVLGTSSDLFEVAGKYEQAYPQQIKYYLFAAAALFAVVVLIIVLSYSYRRIKKGRQISELKEKAPEEKIQKLQKELSALESAYNSKLISKESYTKQKQRVGSEIEKLKRQ